LLEVAIIGEVKPGRSLSLWVSGHLAPGGEGVSLPLWRQSAGVPSIDYLLIREIKMEATKISRGILTAVLALDVLFMAGCSSENSHGNVYRQWSTRMAEMGIFPVYPPREDVVVGDVYALPLHPYDTAAVGYIGGLGNAGIHVEYLGDRNLGWTNLLARLERYYETRPYPADSTNIVSSVTNAPLTSISGYPETTQRTSAFSPGSIARLRQVSFPDFNISHVDQESLSAVIPIEGIMAGLNFNRSDITGVHFSIPHAESYGLTTEDLLEEVYHDDQFRPTPDGIYMRGDTNGVISVMGAQMAYGMFQDILARVAENPGNHIPWSIRMHMQRSVAAMTNHIYLALISEVYFARSMDITIERKTATGANGSARPIAAAELKQLKDMGLLAVRGLTKSVTSTSTTASATSTNVVTGTKAEMIDVTEGDSAFDLARKLRGLESPDSVDKIGGSVRVLSVSASSIGLRRTFERPICVGVRGVLVKIDVKNPRVFTGTGQTEWMKVEVEDMNDKGTDSKQRDNWSARGHQTHGDP
jgi:hypothetical protein